MLGHVYAARRIKCPMRVCDGGEVAFDDRDPRRVRIPLARRRHEAGREIEGVNLNRGIALGEPEGGLAVHASDFQMTPGERARCNSIAPRQGFIQPGLVTPSLERVQVVGTDIM